jgi:anti-anti-sigma factor
MPVTSEEYNKVCVLTLDGDFAGEEVAAARKIVEDQIDKKQIVHFVLDFEKSGFVDSEGLEALLWVKRKCEDLFGQVKLAATDENVRKILEVTRLVHRFQCHSDVTTALKNMR